MSHKLFDRSKLLIKPLEDRCHDLSSANILELKEAESIESFKLAAVAEEMIAAKRKNSSVIMFMGGHVVRSGVQKYIIDLMERGYISCLSMNGAGIIHDYEFALIGATTESVARYISEGQFGLWKETAGINDVVSSAYAENPSIGLGAAVGSYILNNEFPFKEISLLAAASRLGIPVTAHVGIGYDIIHEHPNFNAAATGSLSYNDFLILANVVYGLEGGVVMNFGSAVMAPEVYLKSLSMARNVAFQEGRKICHFTSLVCDLVPLPDDIESEPSKREHSYFFRPWKTMLVRTIKDGGKSYYVQGGHVATIPELWTHIRMLEAAHG